MSYSALEGGKKGEILPSLIFFSFTAFIAEKSGLEYKPISIPLTTTGRLIDGNYSSYRRSRGLEVA